MKRQNVALMLVLAVLLVAGTAESAGLRNSRQTVVLECGAVTPEFPPPDFTPILEVIAVSGTPGAPAISAGDLCAIAIGALMNNRFRLLSATATSPKIPGGEALPPAEVSSVQYLFVSKPGHGGSKGYD